MPKILKFFKVMFSEWGSGLSGPASVPFTALALFVSNPAQKTCYAFLAIILGLISAYRIWSKEYARAEIESAKHLYPNIQPEMLGCLWDIEDRHGGTFTFIHPFVRLTNLVAVDTLITKYEVTVQCGTTHKNLISEDKFASGEFSTRRETTYPGHWVTQTGKHITPFASLERLVSNQSPLTRGIHIEGWLRFSFDINRDEVQLTGDEFPATLFITVTDSFGRKHSSQPTSLAVKYGHVISWMK